MSTRASPSAATLRTAFERTFGRSDGLWIARAPGRVNLIGEHVDYNDLPVLPMALQRAVWLGFRPRDDARIRLVDDDPRFGAREFEIAPDLAPFAAGDWGNYAKAAARILALEHGAARGLDGVIASDLPAAAGLSSSAALVIATLLAVCHANRVELAPLALAELAARGERFVGTHGGGMDQAACIGGRAEHALEIHFAPLSVEALPVPPNWRFVIADSLVVADKSGGARERYNARRASCAAALARVRELAGMPSATYQDLVSRYPADELVALGARALGERGELLRRFRHVITENDRVRLARRALLDRDPRAFGRSMNASHASLRDDYEVSCPELDRLVELQRTFGSHGARVTGAGFGGSTVALVDDSGADALVGELDRAFYAARGAPAATLIARASDGARTIPAP